MPLLCGNCYEYHGFSRPGRRKRSPSRDRVVRNGGERPRDLPRGINRFQTAVALPKSDVKEIPTSGSEIRMHPSGNSRFFAKIVGGQPSAQRTAALLIRFVTIDLTSCLATIKMGSKSGLNRDASQPASRAFIFSFVC